ncbi:two component transcriptional regulator, LytTR family [Mariniphaga anaerophila]|uniref:Two component transcriptional regulator, LytTR family n=1 Tax=Mariniphaga anaerophila TaxID=1484053 RepID=A0A1M4XNL8_9BACT|nr:LytTR family DNA-binding domain-containing protein [Mariniphaga anaerophila]SHE94966.1 two component transcriptional regulator, LytTR family [Mariniphaga anaerophila]
MKTNCLIVDDEPLARELMRNHIQKLDNFNIAGECGDAMKALEVLRNQKVDLMFMDIQMPQITGIEFLKTLKQPPHVIITTAYREYALEGFELDVVDYLLKPITFERFLKAVNKFYQVSADNHMSAENYAQPNGADDAFIYVKENKKVLKLHLADILYIEGLSEYVKIHTADKRIVTKASMTNMEEKLPDSDFMRIHKSYIVSLRKIEAFTSTSIEIEGKELPIGRSFKNRVAAVLHAGNSVVAS